MADFSKEVDDAFLDAGGSKILEACHKKYLNGDRASIMEALFCCALFNETMPDWVADELLAIDEKLDGEFKDMNEFFGFKRTNKNTAKKLHEIDMREDRALSALFNHSLDGGNWTAGNGLEKIKENTGIPRRVIGYVRKKYKILLDSFTGKRNTGVGYLKADAGKPLIDLAKQNRSRKK